jgi:hypothetical protein
VNGSTLYRESQRAGLDKPSKGVVLIGKTDPLTFDCQSQKYLLPCSDGSDLGKQKEKGDKPMIPKPDGAG